MMVVGKSLCGNSRTMCLLHCCVNQLLTLFPFVLHG